ncbi:MAG: DUF72 domain-containing protein [Thermodesulfobacteriota bacterium]|nr:DUF72 domain-containing protein [Thermodesulfobacteriota bacterium]
MSVEEDAGFEDFLFRDLHSNVFMGTASDRYASWIGQIYSQERFGDSITRRSKTVGGKAFVEEILPVESVEEYFMHFRTLELDFTFYAPLLDKYGNPTRNFHALSSYCRHLGGDDRVILKTPQTVFAKRLRRKGAHVENAQYLDPELFVRQFYEPAIALLGSRLGGLIFEQEYQRKQDRCPPEEVAEELNAFFEAVPMDTRYHVEFRTETFLSDSVFDVFERHGVGQVLSHWTWLPPLSRQFALSGQRFLNRSKRCIIRLMTPRRVRYESAYAQAHPFKSLTEGMPDGRMVEETAELMWAGVDQGVQVHVVINNRSGGNAPIIAQHVARRFLGMRSRYRIRQNVSTQ